jgi:hypothetical protein
VLAALVVVGVGLAGTVVATAGEASAAAGCAVTYSVDSQWAGGFVAAITVSNLGDPVTSWAVDWSFGAGQRVGNAWNATVTQSGGRVTAASVASNGAVRTGASASFGFQGTWTGTNPVPSGFTLNGVACTGAAAPTSSPTVKPSAPPSTAPGCPYTGRITYRLDRAPAPTPAQQNAYNLITTAMNQALAVYNCHTDIAKTLTVSYVPSVATADANDNGTIRFGATSSMQRITAMHEIGHTMGVGTVSAWSARLSGGVWTGGNANAVLRAITGDPNAAVHGDAAHFWPYGLNYTSEVTSEADLVNHCKVVMGLRRDMGL